MSKSINMVFLIGNLGKDPDVRTIQDGSKVATFSLATSTGGYKRKDGTDVPERTEWHRIVCFRNLAELVDKYVHKGDRISVSGSIRYGEYEKDGVKRQTTDIIASDIVLASRTDGTQPQRPAQQPMPQMPQQPAGGYEPQPGMFGGSIDTLPF